MIKLTKQQVAERQLMTAIRIWSEAGDAVSIHTLAAASLEILDEIATANAAGGSILRNPAGLIIDSKIREYHSLIRKPQNFFKHANEDLHEVIEFNETIPEMFLLDALGVYGRLKGEGMALECKMAFWYLVLKNEAIVDPDYVAKNELFYSELKRLYRVVDRRDFVYMSMEGISRHLDH